MKTLILSLLIIALLSTIIIASESIIEKETKKVQTKDLKLKTIEKENKTKLMNIYGNQFQDLKEFNNYKQYEDITIINVTIKTGNIEYYARIITNTNKFNEVLK